MVILKEEGAIAQKTGREQVAKLIGWEYLKSFSPINYDNSIKKFR
ncbi:hypothetical protein QUB07_05215 [Microcoleus sp. F8-C5]